MLHTLPRLRIAHLPTPVEPMPRLSAALGGPNLLVKRDDLTGLALGGNKTRKLELLTAAAQADGAHTLITAGAVQSNHCRQTAAAAARLGLGCILVLPGEPQPPDGNLLLDTLFGAEIVWAGDQPRQQALDETFKRAWTQGRRPYLIPYGGSNELGASAYALAMLELHEQGFAPDWHVVASSSGGTQAGMALGQRLAGIGGRVLGISVDEPAAVLQARVAALATAAADLVNANTAFRPDDILVDDHYLGGGYGVLGDPEREAMRLFAQTEGLLLDPVYTARAAAGLIDLARQGFFKPEETVLFWHTGGAPALFAQRYVSLSVE